jgi:20S proteasome alpha/beta subunit
VTLCIAAACRDGKKERIVIGTDWRIESEIAAGADIQDKVYWVNDDMPMLVSGNVTRSVELRDSYKVLLDSWGKESPPKRVTRANIRSFIKAGARLFKRELANEVATFASGLSYEEMRAAVSRKEIPTSVSVPIYRRIEKVDFECDVVVVAFTDDNQYMFQIDRNGHFEQCESFAVVGEGAYVAQAALYLRKHDPEDSLKVTLYHVFEAMHLVSKCVGSVSRYEHTINVLYPPKERGEHVTADYLTGKGFKRLRASYKEDFGMRAIKNFPDLPTGSLKKDDF